MKMTLDPAPTMMQGGLCPSENAYRLPQRKLKVYKCKFISLSYRH